MRVVDVKNLELYEYIGKGAFGQTMRVSLNGTMYCFKIVLLKYENDIWNNIKNLTDIDFDRYYLAPYSMIESHSICLGYISKYYDDLVKIDRIKNLNKRIVLLKDVKEKIETLHKEYKLIHGDLTINNLLFDKKNYKAYLIDFDSALNVNQKVGSTDSFKLFVKENYIKYYGVNYELDTYVFNVTTLMILYNYRYIDTLFEDIKSNEFEISNINSDVKKLAKKLLLEDTRHNYKSDYIIDYY